MMNKRLAVLFLVLVSFQQSQGLLLAAPEPAQEHSQLTDRVAALENQVRELQERYQQSAGFSDTEYILRVQSQYEQYYEKVLNTQTNTLWGVGILLTVLLAIGGRFTFRMFDRQIEYTMRGVASELKRSFESKVEGDVKRLEERNAKQVAVAIETLKEETTRAIEEQKIVAKNNGMFDLGLIFLALGQHDKAIDYFRQCLLHYLEVKDRKVIDTTNIRNAIGNLFGIIRTKDRANFEANAKQELQNEMYQQLKDELQVARAWYRPLDALLAVEGATGPDEDSNQDEEV
jgi:tetratricopeptide (TPR) repeat protein